ncbi:hypothetical protein J2T60_002207 [Natronospira proteinivora]|uniref:Lipoprotein n=1 Tax=Natronospira proteinivora TaxID=1807133 RepID=A0ABT1GA63_9GAMM|nr:hypothetical protein [Natronospira proteinivora]MCP1728207.1 hypothetical protein [Natronospira proteinivora]
MMARTPFILFLAVFVIGCSNRTDPLQEPSLAVPENTSSEAPSLDDIERCIMVTAELNGWLPERGSDRGRLKAQRHVRSHRAFIDIFYDEESIDVQYADSINLNYVDRPPRSVRRYKDMNYTGPVIHPIYNQWVETLSNDLEVRLRQPDFLCERMQGIRN